MQGKQSSDLVPTLVKSGNSSIKHENAIQAQLQSKLGDIAKESDRLISWRCRLSEPHNKIREEPSFLSHSGRHVSRPNAKAKELTS